MTTHAKWRVYRRQTKDLLDHLCQIRQFNRNSLKPDFENQLHDPLLLPDMIRAVNLVKTAQKNDWPVVIFGDYDADGTPAAALLTLSFRRLGIQHEVILPTREQGYGLRMETIAQLPSSTKLLMTVDTGITAVEEIKAAKKRGIKVIVLDHHLPKSQLPLADALVDPFLPTSKYPFPYLCGCALAYKLIVALQKDYPKVLSEGYVKWLLDLVAISTVADMMPLVGENRVLVHYGLQVLAKTKRPGLKALLNQAGVKPDRITAGTIGFSIGPRLNASGRLSDNRPAYELLVTDDQAQGEQLALQIDNANRERQGLVEQVLKNAEELLFTQNKIEDHCFVLKGDTWPAGVLGLVAGKLAGRYYRPVVVLSERDGELGGSARSSAGYSIIDGLTSVGGLLTRFGGHDQAAGLSLPMAAWPKFVDGLKSHANRAIDPKALIPSFLADSVLEEPELNLKTVQLCEILQPFGLQNPPPLFVVENVELGQPRSLGSGEHLKFNARVGQLPIEVIGFGWRKRYEANPLTTADLLGHLEANHWNGSSRLQLRLVDFQPVDGQIEVINGQA